MPCLTENYDVAVVGAGHAGCEAALASARLGTRDDRVYCQRGQHRPDAVQPECRRKLEGPSWCVSWMRSAARWEKI